MTPSYLPLESCLLSWSVLLKLGEQLGGHDFDFVVVPHGRGVHFSLRQYRRDRRPVVTAGPGYLLLLETVDRSYFFSCGINAWFDQLFGTLIVSTSVTRLVMRATHFFRLAGFPPLPQNVNFLLLFVLLMTHGNIFTSNAIIMSWRVLLL